MQLCFFIFPDKDVQLVEIPNKIVTVETRCTESIDEKFRGVNSAFNFSLTFISPETRNDLTFWRMFAGRDVAELNVD